MTRSEQDTTTPTEYTPTIDDAFKRRAAAAVTAAAEELRANMPPDVTSAITFAHCRGVQLGALLEPLTREAIERFGEMPAGHTTLLMLARELVEEMVTALEPHAEKPTIAPAVRQ